MRSFPVLLLLSGFLVALPALGLAQVPGKANAPAAGPDKVAATVNGEKIMESEITRFLDRQLRGQKLPDEQMAQLRQRVLESLVSQSLLTQYVAKQNIQVDPKEVDQKIAELKQRIAASGGSFDEMLKSQGMTEADVRKLVGPNLALEKFLDKAVTDQQIQAYYDAHKDELGGDEVRASHILVKFSEGAKDKAADKQDALNKIKKVQQELGKGLDFAEAAKKYSDCPSKANGGDLNFFPRQGAMVEPFAAAAFALKKGDVSQPVETEFGWHLIKCTDRRSKKLEDVRDEIKSALSQDIAEKLVEEQRKTAKIEYPK